MPDKTVVVYDKNGIEGFVDVDTPEQSHVIVRVNERRVSVPRELILDRDGRRELPIAYTQLVEDGRIIVPLAAEFISVGKVERETGRVRISKRVETHTETVDEMLRKEQVDVERVAVNEVVNEAQGIRQEGDITIIPLYEEVLVVEKRLLLKEELRIRKTQSQEPYQEAIILREEVVDIDHIDTREIDD